MRVHTEKQRAFGPLLRAVFADCLRDRQDVILVKCRMQRTAAVPGSSEGNTLGCDRHLRLQGKIRSDQTGNIDKLRRVCRLAGTWVNGRHNCSYVSPAETSISISKLGSGKSPRRLRPSRDSY